MCFRRLIDVHYRAVITVTKVLRSRWTMMAVMLMMMVVMMVFVLFQSRTASTWTCLQVKQPPRRWLWRNLQHPWVCSLSVFHLSICLPADEFTYLPSAVIVVPTAQQYVTYLTYCYALFCLCNFGKWVSWVRFGVLLPHVTSLHSHAICWLTAGFSYLKLVTSNFNCLFFRLLLAVDLNWFY